MGFSMRLRDTLTVILPFVLMFLLGCEIIQKAEEEDGSEAYGPEVTDDQLDLALSKAVHGYTIDNTEVGQFVETVDVRRLENEDQVTTLAGMRVEIDSKEVIEDTEDQQTVHYHLNIFDSVRLPDGSFETKNTGDTLEVTRSKNSAPSVMAMDGAAQYFENKALKNFRARPAAKRVTKHNLKTYSQRVEVPPSVKGRPGCGGVASCSILVHYIEYDFVEWDENNRPLKIHLDFGFSVDTPFIPFGDGFEKLTGLMVKFCRSTYIPITGRTVYVRDCNNVENFQR